MQLHITIAVCIVEIRNRKSLQSKVNICKSDVKIGDYADSLMCNNKIVINIVLCLLYSTGHIYKSRSIVDLPTYDDT